MTQHITQEVAIELSIKAGDEFAIHEAEFYTNLCNAAIQHYLDQRKAELPVLPDHPEPRTMKWSALEIEAIQAYGLQCAAHAREMALNEAKLVAKTTCHHESTEFANGFNMAALNIESAIEALKGKR